MNRLYFFLLIIFFGSFSPEDDFISQLRNKSEAHFSKYKRAKLEVFFNQPKYAAGDTVRFRINYVKAADLKPITERQIVRLNWFDQYGKKAMTQWASVVNGLANCEMVLPKGLSLGNYVVVAYTDWMKNFDQSLFFRQRFVVAGKYAIAKAVSRDSILFYPEGGALVANVENNLAILYRGQERVNRISIKESGQEISSIVVSSDSVSSFKFIPKISANYSAELTTPGGVKKFAFPIIKSTGISLQVDASSDKLKIVSEIQGEGSRKEKYYVAIFNNKGLIFQNGIDFSENQKTVITLPSNLSPGIAQLVLSDSKFNLIASRVIYVGNPSTKKVKLSNLQSSYATRQSVKLKLQVVDADGNNVAGDFSCRVINDGLLHESNLSALTYLTFQSDIDNTFDFENKVVNSNAVNSYLITQTCPWFNWKKLLSDDKATFQYKPQEYLSISGSATNIKDGKPVKDSTLLMFYLEKSLQGYETYTSEKGKFTFALFPVVTRSDKFFYAASFKERDLDDVSVRIFDLDSLITFSAEPFTVEKTSPDAYATYSAQRTTIDNSYSFFVNPATLNDSIDDANKPMEDELNGSDIAVTLTDFLMMPTMEEVIREILKAVDYRKVNGRNVVRVYTTSNKKPTNYTGPLYVIDGVLTKDPNYLISLKPTDVVSLKVVRDTRKLFPLGKIGANGVIMVKTKKANSIVHETHVIDFPGLLQAGKFDSGQGNLQYPNLKSCLYWNPRVNNQLNSGEIDFSTSDDVGVFKLQVYGLAEDGTSIYSEYPFTVNFIKN